MSITGVSVEERTAVKVRYYPFMYGVKTGIFLIMRKPQKTFLFDNWQHQGDSLLRWDNEENYTTWKIFRYFPFMYEV
jgi:hypothetical protein